MIEEISKYLPVIISGTLMTFKLFALTLIISLPLGLPITLGSNSKIAPIRWFCRFFVLIFRGTPLMLQLFFFYFFLPLNLGIKMDVFSTAILTFALNYAAYFAEIYRGGIASIDKGQYEAAHSLQLSKSQTLFDIILPQAMKAIFPSIMNEMITLVKDTALVQALGMMELMKVTYGIVNATSTTWMFVVAGIIYLTMTSVLTLAASRVEKYFKRYDRKGD